ncbi:cytochrome c oxidase, subunit VIa [Abortiporus biennis]|nr:cytochrome c oxidase, subunit VIa [Abortiporus biennis]
MSMIARRAFLRAASGSRSYSATAGSVAKSKYHEELAALQAHAGETTEMWRKISFFVCIPAIVVTGIWVYKVEAEHAEHDAHLRAEHGGELPEVPAYEYLNKRSKPFPWGNNSLFFNPKYNKNVEA